MIFTDRKITIRNGKSSINEPVILYRGDYEVSIRFTIMESKFRFKSGVNLVDSEKASHGQLAILAPYGGNVFSEVVKCEDGAVTFTLTKEMIDQLEEVGLYSFQIRLFDYYRESRVSIPPVEFGIEVREPVASEDHDNEVNNAIVGYSIAKVVDGLNEDVPDTFDSNGQYNKTNWKTGDRISQGKLNKIEDALDKINQNEKNDKDALNKQMNSNFNVLTSKIDTKVSNDDFKVLNSTVNKKADTTYVDNKVQAAASGSPKGVYATVAALQSAIPKGDKNIYVVIADGCWYYWNGSVWTKGGQYQSTGIENGSIVYDSLSESLKQNDNVGTFHKVIPTTIDERSSWIDVNTTTKEITIVESQGGRTTAYGYTNLERSSASGIPNGTYVVSYANIDTSAIFLYYDKDNKRYFAQSYSAAPPKNSLFICGMRVTNGYSTHPEWVTFNGGKTDTILVRRLLSGVKETGLIRRGSIDCMSREYRSIILWDLVNKKVTIPNKMNILYGALATYPQAQEISYTTNSVLLTIGYNTKTGLFDVRPYSDSDDPDFYVYDYVRNDSAFPGSLLTDSIYFVGYSKLKYLGLDMGRNMRDYHLTYVNTSHSATNSAIAKDEMYGFISASVKPTDGVMIRPNQRNKSGIFSEFLKFTTHDDVAGIEVSISKPDKYYLYWAIRSTKPNSDFMSGYEVATIRNYAGSLDESAKGKVRIDIANYLRMAQMVNEADAIFVQLQLRSTDGSVIPEEDLDEINTHIEVLRAPTVNKKYEELPNVIDINSSVVKSSDGRLMFDTKIPANINTLITLGADKTKVNYNDTKVNIYFGLHGYNESNIQVYDANWLVGESQATVAENIVTFNPYAYETHRYSTYAASNIPNISYYRVYIGFNGSLDFTLTTMKEISKLFTIRFDTEQLNYDYNRFNMLENPHLKTKLLQQLMNNDEDDPNDSIHMVSEQIFTTNASNLDTCIIPARAKGYIVEFRGKVSSGEGFIQFSDAYDRMSLVDTKYRTYKMRFNKLDDVTKNINVSVTVPSGGSLTIRNLKVIPQYDEVPSTHANKSSFYLHRGYSSAYPENSLLAVEEACKRGCSVIEVDIYTSVDNKAIISHDASLGRTNKDRPTVSFTNTEQFSRQAGNKIWVDSAILDEFRVHDYLTVIDNGVTRYVTVYGISGNILTLNSSVLTGPITRISNGRRTCYSCTEAEFMEYEIGAYKNAKFAGEYNRPFDDYIRVVSRYEAALLLDMRSLSKECFTNHIAPLLDRYNYWDKCYFMHGESACDNYHSWAGEIGRKIVIMPITYATGDDLTAQLNRYGSKEHPHALRKDIAISQEGITKEHMDLAHSYGIRVHTFTVNTIAAAQKLIRMGVDIIGGDYFSDDTAILW